MAACNSARACTSFLVEKTEEKMSRGEKKTRLVFGKIEIFLISRRVLSFVSSVSRQGRKLLSFNFRVKQMVPGLEPSDYIPGREAVLIKGIFCNICGLVTVLF